MRSKLEDLAAPKKKGAGSTGAKSAGPEAKSAAADAEPAPPAAPPPDPAALRAELETLNRELEKVQGETPLMQACVNSQTIAEVISGWTGIPVGKMLTDEIHTVLTLKDRLEQRVIGPET